MRKSKRVMDGGVYDVAMLNKKFMKKTEMWFSKREWLIMVKSVAFDNNNLVNDFKNVSVVMNHKWYFDQMVHRRVGNGKKMFI